MWKAGENHALMLSMMRLTVKEIAYATQMKEFFW